MKWRGLLASLTLAVLGSLKRPKGSKVAESVSVVEETEGLEGSRVRLGLDGDGHGIAARGDLRAEDRQASRVGHAGDQCAKVDGEVHDAVDLQGCAVETEHLGDVTRVVAVAGRRRVRVKVRVRAEEVACKAGEIDLIAGRGRERRGRHRQRALRVERERGGDAAEPVS